jgi:hypothetical protein
LTGDHIPSNAALKKFWENLLGRPLSPAEERFIQENGTSLALRDELHALSRTFRGRNTGSQIAQDADDLFKAAIKDTWKFRQNGVAAGVPEAKIDEIIVEIHIMNKKLGIY